MPVPNHQQVIAADEATIIDRLSRAVHSCHNYLRNLDASLGPQTGLPRIDLEGATREATTAKALVGCLRAWSPAPDLDPDRAALAEECDRLRAQVADLTAERTQLSDSMHAIAAAAENERDRLRADLARSEDALRSRTAERDSAQRDCDQIYADRDYIVEERNRLHVQVADMTDQRDTYEKAATEAEEECDRLRAQVERANANRDDAVAAAIVAEEERDRLRALLASLVSRDQNDADSLRALPNWLKEKIARVRAHLAAGQAGEGAK